MYWWSVENNHKNIGNVMFLDFFLDPNSRVVPHTHTTAMWGSGTMKLSLTAASLDQRGVG